MPKLFLLVFALCCTVTCVAQQEFGKTIFISPEPQQLVTIEASIEGKDMNEIGEFKDKLLAYEEKVSEVEIDNSTQLMYITYNEHMLLEDLRELFERYAIPYRREH